MSDGIFPGIDVTVENVYQDLLKTLFDSGFFGDKTWSEVQREQPDVVPRLRCRMPERAATGASRWTMLDVTYSHRVSLPGLTDAEADATYRQACNAWNAVCGIKLAYSPSFNTANIYANSGNIDGSSGTLAWSYLPPQGANSQTRLEQLYDNSEAWTRNWALEVMIHEIGHALGLEHDTDKSAIMYPYSAGGKMLVPQPRDISRIQGLYGKPTTPPATPPTGDAPQVGGVLVINGVAYTVKLEPQ